MNIEVTKEQKNQIAMLTTERQLIAKLLNERQKLLELQVIEVLKANNLDARVYNISFNLQKDTWEAQLRPGVLSLPNQPKKKIIKTN